MRGNCYVATEALWHILGGPAGPWQVMRVPLAGDTHWFLQHRYFGTILDPSRRQFHGTTPAYHKAVGAGFLTKKPSKRARAMMSLLTWQDGTHLASTPRTRRQK